jgi:hypothetical protein
MDRAARDIKAATRREAAAVADVDLAEASAAVRAVPGHDALFEV